MSTATNVSVCGLKLNDYYASCVHWQAWIKKQSLFLPCRGPKQTSHVGSCCKLSLLAPHVSCTLKYKKKQKNINNKVYKNSVVTLLSAIVYFTTGNTANFSANQLFRQGHLYKPLIIFGIGYRAFTYHATEIRGSK